MTLNNFVAGITAVSGILALQTGAAFAEWSLTAGTEYFRWRESTSPAVNEAGGRGALGFNWSQDKPSGWRAAYRFKYYLGNVDYDGFSLRTGAAISASTGYTGFSNEIQAIYRPLNNPVEFHGGLGWDAWQRRLSPQQKEDWNVYYVTLGVNVNNSVQRGVFVGGGVKYPIYVTENANLVSAGFDQNPRLHPGPDYSLFGELGYRFNHSWDVVGYYDSYRFRQSNGAHVTSNATIPGGSFTVFQPKSKMDVVGLKLRYTFR